MTASRSFFSQISKYVPTLHRNPREDMLTQLFAAILEEADGLPHFLANRWIEGVITTDQRGPVRVRPQLPLRSGDRIDLVLQFLDESGNASSLFWIEVKVAAHLSGGNQLAKYEEQLRAEEAREKYLVFLPPAGYVPQQDETLPDDLVETNWQLVGEQLTAWQHEQTDTLAPAAWIVEQFLKHLEEEQLYMNDPLSAEDVEHLEAFTAASGRLDALLTAAMTQIDERLEAEQLPTGSEDERDSSPKRGSKWPEFWRWYGPQSDLLGAQFDWTLRTLAGEDRPAFGAGLTFDRDTPIGSDLDAHDAERRRFVDSDFAWIHDPDYCHAFRTWDLQEFLNASDGTLDGQTKQLSQWVGDAFKQAYDCSRSI